MDIPLRKARAVRRAEWLARRGRAVESRYRAALLDSGMDENGDHVIPDPPVGSLEIIDGTGASAWKVKALALQSFGNELADAGDGGVLLREYRDSQVTKFAADGAVAWKKEKVAGESMAVDRKSGDIWLRTHDEVGGKWRSFTLVLDRDGKPLRDLDVPGSPFAYSAHDGCFWALGEKLAKASADGKVLAEVSLAAPSPLGSRGGGELSVNEADGSVWTLTRSGMGHDPNAAQQLSVTSADGRLLKQWTAGGRGVYVHSVHVDGARGVAWLKVYSPMNWHIERRSLADNQRLGDEIPMQGDVSIEPDTGCAWVAGPEGVGRLDPDGNPIWFRQTPGNTEKVVEVIGKP